MKQSNLLYFKLFQRPLIFVGRKKNDLTRDLSYFDQSSIFLPVFFVNARIGTCCSLITPKEFVFLWLMWKSTVEKLKQFIPFHCQIQTGLNMVKSNCIMHDILKKHIKQKITSSMLSFVDGLSLFSIILSLYSSLLQNTF